MIEFRINQRHLKAVALAAAKKDRRDYLNGVRIEVYTDPLVVPGWFFREEEVQ